MPPTAAATPASTKASLRFYNLISFPVAFVMLLVHGITSHEPFPALGLIPLAASAIVSGLILYRDHVAVLGSPIQVLSATNILFADLAILILESIFLIITWATLTSSWDRGLIVLGTYGSVFLMANVSIHAYFVVSQSHIIQVNHACTCEHCAAVNQSQAGPTEYDRLSAGYDDLENRGKDIDGARSAGQ